MKYIKKPIVIEAVQWTGDNLDEITSFMNCEALSSLCIDTLSSCEATICIDTLEGVMTASKGDYIIKGISGEFYPCKPDIFHKTYEPVDAPEGVVGVLPMPKWLQEDSDE